jgi:UDP-N-acetylmuramoylalanine--D-glutamate ligase
MENYINLKLRVFANQNGSNKSVVNSDDEILSAFNSNSETWRFSTKHRVDLGCYIENEIMKLKTPGKDAEVIHIGEIGITGPHNLSNACAAATCCAAAGIDIKAIADGLRSFKGVEHRLEKVGLIGGVSFINDSKATNVDAVYWALQSVSPPIVLIAGGRDKNGDFTTLRDLIRERVKAAVLIGEAASKMAVAWDGITEIVHAGTMEEAIRSAYAKARPEGSVLLSPACASYDMFDNYEQRGWVFKQAVNKLIGERG